MILKIHMIDWRVMPYPVWIQPMSHKTAKEHVTVKYNVAGVPNKCVCPHTPIIIWLSFDAMVFNVFLCCFSLFFYIVQ